MLEFIIALAQGVLQSIIVDLVTGRSSAARKKEIEVAIATAARERRTLSQEQLDDIVHYTMREISHYIERDPDLEWKFHSLRLAPQVEKLAASQNDQEVLSEQLRRLNDIVARRRMNLGLPLSSAVAGNAAGEDRTNEKPIAHSSVQWEDADGQIEADLWKQELEAMKTRIRERRGSRA